MQDFDARANQPEFALPDRLAALYTSALASGLLRDFARADRAVATAQQLLASSAQPDAATRRALARLSVQLALARDEGLTVREERYSLDQWRDDAASGKLVETFACGTAAVVTPVGRVVGRDGEFTIGSGGPGQLTQKLKARLVSIQRGEAPDPHGWVMKLD